MPTQNILTDPPTVLRLCGTLELQIAGQEIAGALPGGQATALFARLAMSSRPLSRDELQGALWPGPPVSDPRAVLSTLLSRLRRVLGPEAVSGRAQVQLTLPPPVWLDVEAARVAVQTAREAMAVAAWPRLFEQCRFAREILERGFLPGHDAPWIDACRSDLEDLHLAALELESRAGLAAGEPELGRAERAAACLIAIAPYREVGHRLLMEALERKGNVAEALRVYEGLRVLLRDELGTAPALELRSVHARLLTGGPPGGPPMKASGGGTSADPRPVTRAASPAATFVGRGHELDHLEALRRSGSRRLIAVAGEPGIGKTRLVSEFVDRAEASGALVLHGRCDEETLVPYQPFIEALRGYVARCPVEQLRRQLGESGPELSRILPMLRRRLPDLPEPPSAEPQTERFRLFELVAAFFSQIEASAALVLVLDDIHWADRPTLQLLRHLLRTRDGDGDSPLTLATYRTTEIGSATSELLAELRREQLVESISLAGLGAAEVSALLADWAGAPPPSELARAMHEQTQGNPFFVEEFLRYLAEAGAASPGNGRWSADIDLGGASVPEGVKHLVGRRLARTAPHTRRVLVIAAMIGERFSFDALERLTELSGEALAEALEEAVAAQLIAEQPGAFGAYGFSHALIRETLRAELTVTRRVLLHRRIGDTLEELYAGNVGPHLAELAHHFAEAAQDHDPARAIDYGERAAERAEGMLAYEEAARHYGRALRALDLGALPQKARRCELLTARGEAERLAGDPAHRETLLEAAGVASALGDPERLARAALANNRGFFSSSFRVDAERVSVLERALEAYDTADSPTRARLLAQLSVELVADPDWDRRLSVSDEALAMARRVGDPETLALVLDLRFVTLWGPRTLPERRMIAAEARDLAASLRDSLLAFYPALFGAHAEMELGGLAEAAVLIARARALATELGQPTLSWYAAVSRAKHALITGAAEQRRAARA